MGDKKDPLLIHAERLSINTVLLDNKLVAAALVCFTTVPPVTPDAFMRLALAAYAETELQYTRLRDTLVENWKAKNEPEDAATPSPQSDPKGVE